MDQKRERHYSDLKDRCHFDQVSGETHSKEKKG